MITYIQIGLALLVAIAILLQQRGTGLSSMFGGNSLEYSTKRGAEKIIFYATIVFVVAFLVVSVLRILLS
ncbi:MAG: preprotein translocase subunit SecG [Candidatus Yanofskybacteria bacterium RIFCSPHIGHO2_01_FULL_41_27]|uniref:Protein-export membrane protein SecG n=2 Tax=Candidatus Yanofskyibacteriota TaxID=1752733 RepID=A0A1F8HU97_9BACT|nr:MAG: preprotein translocase subunit SecG [Candidatus Yanofskybacteria bacterium RIFCSPHIGHO2_01_FULL_41_27]OGN21818.1 MAG: preprotein translocase subunit SecG [Candidatus Yanofskybacteria bacterium RIFCSPLOWO2_01_FULL_41_33]OGN41174.1 MAG: preprotein translocase subunit SecG [Candidatus Yanofskybacteria bacterium RIFOXYD1_FULL_42_10]HLD34619.1 preprotein translocase subunit SecG [Patescibacteria group bacterium]